MEHTAEASALRSRATAISDAARQDQSVAAFDPVTLIMLLMTIIPALLKCFNPDPAPASTTSASDVKKYVNGQYDAASNKYDAPLVNRVSARIFFTALAHGRATTTHQRHVLAARILDDLRTQSDATVNAVIAESNATPTI